MREQMSEEAMAKRLTHLEARLDSLSREGAQQEVVRGRLD